MNHPELVEPAWARARVLQAASPLPSWSLRVQEVLGLRLAESVRAPGDLPPFPRVMMDGYAVRLKDAGRVVRLLGEVAAGQEGDLEVPQGGCVAVMTGAPCPGGAEAVVALEEADRTDGQVRLPDEVGPKANIAPRGTDCRTGTEVLTEGTKVTPLVLGVIAALGLDRVAVRPRPSVSLIITGNELAPDPLMNGGPRIPDSNGPMLDALVRRAGGDVRGIYRAEDSLPSLAGALDRCSESDLVILSGGVSAGRYDLVPRALVNAGVTLLFHKVRQKPGKPVLAGTRGNQVFFGLPGTPLGCLVAFHLYAGPALRNMAGDRPGPPTTTARLTGPLNPALDRTWFVPGKTQGGPEGLRVQPLVPHSSSDLFTAAAADVLVEIAPGGRKVEAGAMVEATWLD